MGYTLDLKHKERVTSDRFVTGESCCFCAFDIKLGWADSDQRKWRVDGIKILVVKSTSLLRF